MSLRKRSILLPWVQGRLAAKGPAALESSSSSERALGYGGKKVEVEKVWRELFSNPGEWRDHRLDKANPSFPDFRHKKYTQKALWLDSKCIPSWVKAKLASLPPNTIQMGPFSWNQRLSRYVQAGQYEKTLELFRQMQHDGNANRFTFPPVLKACANLSALEVGRLVHGEIIRRGYESDIVVGNCLLDMYAKCGSIEEAEKLFKRMPTRDVVGWTALLAGYGNHGFTIRALEAFKEMCKVVEVDGVVFLSLLSACSHGGLVTEGLEYFKSMSKVFSIIPTAEHFACVVDLLGRAGRLGEAEDLIMSMPIDANASVWTALLSACREHVNVEVGERCAKRLLELEPDNTAAYVLLSNIYVAAGKFESSARLLERVCVEASRKYPGPPGLSCVHSI